MINHQCTGLCIGALLLLPAVALGRSPLTDSTDVKVSRGAIEVENSIVVSPLDPKVLLVSNIDVSAGGVTSWISLDAGKTWSKLGLATAGVDPIVGISRTGGAQGRFFVNHLSEGGVVVDLKDVVDSTTSWRQRTVEPWLVDPEPTGRGWDKNYLWVDNGADPVRMFSGFSDWEELDSGRRVYLKYSNNNGVTWLPATPTPPAPSGILIDAGADPNRNYMGVNLATGAGGRVHAAWAARDLEANGNRAKEIMFRYSDDGGVAGSWQSPTYGQTIKNLVGFGWHSLAGKTMRVPVSPSMVTNGDTVWVVYADKRDANDTDIFILRSDNKGLTWNALSGSAQDPDYKQVNSAESAPEDNRDQWFPWIARDDCTGALVAVYYDSRDVTDRVNTYMAVSYTGGVTWEPDFKVSDMDWDGDPPAGADPWAGDYISVAARDGIAFPVWSDDRPPLADDNYRAFTSPVYLWGIKQESIQHTVTSDPELVLSVSVSWQTNRSATGPDCLVLTSPMGLQYTQTGTGTGTSHSLSKTCTCEPGWWTYIVKSTRPSFTTRGSDERKFLANCLD